MVINPKTKVKKMDLTPEDSKSLISISSGVKIRVAGRFYREAIIPKKTAYCKQRGSLARGVVNFVESSKYINKSKRGSFCITVTLSHVF